MEFKRFANEAEWLKYRKNSIGGSDLGGIMGVSAYSTIADVAHDKKLPVAETQEENPFALLGKMMEKPIFDKYVKVAYPDAEHGTENLEIATDPAFPGMHATIDGIVKDKRIIEIKFVSLRGTSKWIGLDGNLAVPLEYVYQVQLYMAIYNLPLASVFAFFQEYGKAVEFPIERDESIIGLIKSKVGEFWRDIDSFVRPISPTETPNVEHVEPLLQNVQEAIFNGKRADIARVAIEEVILAKYDVGDTVRWNAIKGKITMFNPKNGNPYKKLKLN